MGLSSISKQFITATIGSLLLAHPKTTTSAFTIDSIPSSIVHRSLSPPSSTTYSTTNHHHHHRMRTIIGPRRSTLPLPLSRNRQRQQRQQQRTSTTSLSMGFNLPPNKNSALDEIIPTLVSFTLAALFFMSPLGSLFFAVTNSILILLLLTPLALTIGFKVWQSLYTMESTCPNCSAPITVLKDTNASPGLCLNCGARVRINLKQDGVELCNDPSDVLNDAGCMGSLFDAFFGGAGSGGGFGGADMDGFGSSSDGGFGGRADGEFVSSQDTEVYVDNSSSSKGKKEGGKGSEKNMGNVIDVDVEKDWM